MSELAMAKTPVWGSDSGMLAIARALAKNAEKDVFPRNWAELARHLGITKQAIWQWRRVPVEHVFAIESLFGISHSSLRSDVYPPNLYSVRRTGSRIRLAGSGKRGR